MCLPRVRTFAKTAYPFAYPSVGKVRTLCVPLTCENCVPFRGTQKNPVSVDSERLPDSGSGDSWTRTNDPIDVNDVLYRLSHATVKEITV